MTDTNVAAGILMRCPDWQTCKYQGCKRHKGLHAPDIDCFQKTEGSIRPECCPDCRVESR